MRLSRQGSSSSLGNQWDPVAVADVFRVIGTRRVDIFKMDIEGSEYAILQDGRFACLVLGVIALEWHNTRNIPTAVIGAATVLPIWESHHGRIPPGEVVR